MAANTDGQLANCSAGQLGDVSFARQLGQSFGDQRTFLSVGLTGSLLARYRGVVVSLWSRCGRSELTCEQSLQNRKVPCGPIRLLCPS